MVDPTFVGAVIGTTEKAKYIIKARGHEDRKRRASGNQGNQPEEKSIKEVEWNCKYHCDLP